MALKIVTIVKNPKRKRKLKKKRVKIIRKRVKKVRKTPKKKTRVICAKKNPPTRKRHETIIVGYTAKGKRLYYTGNGFNKLRDVAQKFPGDRAKLEAKRILPWLPHQIYGIRVETY